MSNVLVIINILRNFIKYNYIEVALHMFYYKALM